MIRLCSGDIFDADVDIRVNTVNCVGAMGAGVALAFKTRYPEMFREYQKACKDGRIRPGKIHVWKQLDGTWIINFPTKRHWREPSRYEDIEAGLADLRNYLQEQGHVSIAIPALGCGHGGLDWDRVKGLITDALGNLDAEIHLFGPSSSRAAGEQVKGGIDPHIVEQLGRDGVSILKPGDELYPEPIRGVRATTIFVKGNPAVLARPLLTVFPSRKPDEKEVSAATACVEAIAQPGMAVLLGYGPHIDRDLIRLALEKGACVAIRFEEGISNFRVREDIGDIWDDTRIAVVATEATGRWNLNTSRKMTGLALDLAKVTLVTDPDPHWIKRFADDATRTTHVFFIDYRTSSPAAKHALVSVGAKPVRRDARSGNPSVAEIVNTLGVGAPAITPDPGEQQVDQAEASSEPQSTKHEGTMPQYPKRLIEVDLPIKRISAHARREKSIRHGHISTLHIWWARRPLAACRAIVCAALWPDPADDFCPPRFRDDAYNALAGLRERVTNGLISEDLRRAREPVARIRMPADSRDYVGLRRALLDFIAEFANWDLSTNRFFLGACRALTQSAHESLGGAAGTQPMVVDPFAGGGAIPLEALRVGADAFATDYNPVPVLLNKVILEYIPKYGNQLADEVRKWGHWIRKQAEKELSEFYPKDPDGATPVAYLWARTIKCEGPSCGISIPLIRSIVFSRSAPGWHYELHVSGKELTVGVARGTTSKHAATVGAGKSICPSAQCGYATPAKNVREQLIRQHGGAHEATLLAVLRERDGVRFFAAPSSTDVAAVTHSRRAYREDEYPDDVINDVRPHKNTRGLSAVTRIGIRRFRDLYTQRQALSLKVFLRLITQPDDPSWDPGLRLAVHTLLQCAASRLIFQNCSLSRWHAARDTLEGAFGKQALQNTWDFAESNPVSDGPASWHGALEWVLKVIEAQSAVDRQGHAERAKAQEAILPHDSADALITDPPYFAAIPYGDLSDVFFVWERSFYRSHYPSLCVAGLVEKADELIVTNCQRGPSGEVKDGDFYRNEMTRALVSQRLVIKPAGIGVIVFADSKTTAWEAMLGATIDAGWIVTGSWPIDTELQNRTQAAGAASLQSSIHLVCRPREGPDGSLRVDEIGDWRDVLPELPKRIHAWLPRLAAEGVVGADAIFACLGPALEIFSRYSRVEKASGEAVTLREYLEQVWAVVSKEALNMIFTGADATGFEEDARLTAMWLWTLTAGNVQDEPSNDEDAEADEDDESSSGKKSQAGYALEYDAARKIAQGLGAHLEKLTTVVEIQGETARLLPVAERTKALFGKDQADAPVGKRKKKDTQMKLGFMADLEAAEAESGGWGDKSVSKPGATVLDRLHQTMILFAAGRSEAMRRFLVDDGIGRDQRFWRLAQALSALYPPNTDEKRWVDGVLARKKGLGF